MKQTIQMTHQMNSKLTLIIIAITILTSCQRAERRHYIFPEGYEGWVAVVFNCEGGIEKVKVNERIQFPIPENGILLCSFERSKGILNDSYSFNNGDKVIIHDHTKVNSVNDSTKYLRGEVLSGYYTAEYTEAKFDVIYLNVSRPNIEVSKSLSIFEDKLAKYMELNHFERNINR